MVDPNPSAESVIERQLDAVLVRQSLADAECQRIQRELSEAERRRAIESGTAQRLRLALFDLRGEHEKSFGDANRENLARRIDLDHGPMGRGVVIEDGDERARSGSGPA
jgi:hypothetical protein